MLSSLDEPLINNMYESTVAPRNVYTKLPGSRHVFFWLDWPCMEQSGPLRW